MKNIVLIFVLLFSFQVNAKRVECVEMKKMFAQSFFGDHVYSKERDYLIQLLQSSETWKKIFSNLVVNYDPDKVFFYKVEASVDDLDSHTLNYIAHEFVEQGSECLFLPGFYDFFKGVLKRHVGIVTSAYKDKEVFYNDVVALAKIESKDLSEKDIQLLKNYPEDDLELVRKVKLVLSRRFQEFRKYEEDDQAAFDVTMKELSLKRKSYSYRDASLIYSVGLKSALNALDTHTSYFSSEETQKFIERSNAGFAGLGASLQLAGDGIRVVEVIEGGPAQIQGALQVGDVITKVGETDLSKMSIEDSIKYLKGSVGSLAQLLVRRSGEEQRVDIVRGVVSLAKASNITEVIGLGDKKIGYYKFDSFYSSGGKGQNGSAEDLKTALEEFNQKSVDGIIIDLRFNGGGSVAEVNNMLSYLIPQGPLLQMGNAENQRVLPDDDGGQVVTSKPLVVLVNSFSASASEIFSGVLQDYHRAVVVGASNTYGKGSAQNVIPFDENLALAQSYEDADSIIKVTMQYYYLPSGRTVQAVGVVPDVVIASKNYEKIKNEFLGERQENPNLKATKQAPNLMSEALLWTTDTEYQSMIGAAKRGAVNPNMRLVLENKEVQEKMQSDEELTQAVSALIAIVDGATEENGVVIKIVNSH